MDISVDNVLLFSVSPTQQLVIQDDINSDIFDADMKRRLQWVLINKYEQCFLALKQHWDPILAMRVSQVPTDPDLYAQLVFSQPDYKDRKARDQANPQS